MFLTILAVSGVAALIGIGVLIGARKRGQLIVAGALLLLLAGGGVARAWMIWPTLTREEFSDAAIRGDWAAVNRLLPKDQQWTTAGGGVSIVAANGDRLTVEKDELPLIVESQPGAASELHFSATTREDLDIKCAVGPGRVRVESAGSTIRRLRKP